MPIKRYFSDILFPQVKKDFTFLVQFIQNSYGEYDLAIRENYFNLYYKGNSMGMIKPYKSDSYKISIHSIFFSGTKADNPSYFQSKKSGGAYVNVYLSSKQLHRFLQKKHLAEIGLRIKDVHYGEEIEFEQRLITDNLNRDNIIIIDRQITDSLLKRKRLDLLALKKIENHKYQFLIVEVKLGNNKELEGNVATQLNGYISHLSQHFKEYKTCYEKHYKQKKELGLISIPAISQIDIIEPVSGIILVGGYSGLAKSKIAKLKESYPHIKVKRFVNEI